MTAHLARESLSGDPQDRSALSSELMSVITALWFEIDHHEGAAASTYFTPDAELRFTDAVFRGTSGIEEVYAGRKARGPRVSRHIVANLHLHEVEPHRVRATSVLLIFGADGEAPRPMTSPALVGDVHDEFVLRNGRWLIRSRWIQNLFIDPTTRLAVPLERADE
ncbi:nuclear transport factor 2 family protein [Acrocarpospora catenulata]|uniref:nuclear transport factor 2 family protein n=1 Tax=Acrocarpospora catenulata TaxID=2836182 RepID=UPI001BDA2F45|nr:nuclear transport factor 2 family protein [Acrocarpospora catenulata]